MYPRPKPYEHRKNYTIPFEDIEIFRGGGVSLQTFTVFHGDPKS